MDEDNERREKESRLESLRFKKNRKVADMTAGIAGVLGGLATAAHYISAHPQEILGCLGGIGTMMVVTALFQSSLSDYKECRRDIERLEKELYSREH